MMIYQRHHYWASWRPQRFSLPDSHFVLLLLLFFPISQVQVPYNVDRVVDRQVPYPGAFFLKVLHQHTSRVAGRLSFGFPSHVIFLYFLFSGEDCAPPSACDGSQGGRQTSAGISICIFFGIPNSSVYG